MRGLYGFIFILYISVSVAEDETGNPYLVDALYSAKYTGMCGALRQMSSFQEVTKMPGGDEFILRFIKTEAARLGLTLEAFLDRCASSTKMYKLAVASAKEGQR